MLAQIRCQACGYRITGAPEQRQLFALIQDWSALMLRRAAKGGKTARFLRSRAVPCPGCGVGDAWVNEPVDQAAEGGTSTVS